MLYAIIVVCTTAQGPCPEQDAAWSDRSPPIFSSLEECERSALAHFHEYGAPLLDSGTEYEISIECLPEEEPA